MQDYAEYADELVERIDSGELDPAEVDIRPFVEDEETVLTPALAERLPQEKLDEFNARKRDQLHAGLEREQSERADEFRDELKLLESVTETDPDAITETVTIGTPPNTADITVRTKMTGALQDKLTFIYKNREDASKLDEIADGMIDALMLVIVDDTEPEDDPYRWTQRGVWEAFYQHHGIEGLGDAFETLVEPAMNRADDIKNSRERRRGS